jgi:hypothetical protein
VNLGHPVFLISSLRAGTDLPGYGLGGPFDALRLVRAGSEGPVFLLVRGYGCAGTVARAVGCGLACAASENSAACGVVGLGCFLPNCARLDGRGRPSPRGSGADGLVRSWRWAAFSLCGI